MWLNPDGRDLVVVDFETTDVALANAAGGFPEIIEFGACRVAADFMPTSLWSEFVRPSSLEKVSEFTTELTGITREHLTDAPSFSVVVGRFREWVGREKSVRLAHFGPSDVVWLRVACARERVAWPFLGFSVCVQSLAWAAAARWGYNFGSFSLKEIADRLGVVRARGHRAEADAACAAAVLGVLAKME